MSHRDINPMYVCPECGSPMAVNTSVIGPTTVSRRHYCKCCGHKVVSLTMVTAEGGRETRLPRGQGPHATSNLAERGEIELRYAKREPGQ